jgi:hypothetical protein
MGLVTESGMGKKKHNEKFSRRKNIVEKESKEQIKPSQMYSMSPFE